MFRKQGYLLLISFLLVGLLFTNLHAEKIIGGYPDFEIVESIPVESVLDNPDIRNTPEVWLEMIQNAKKTLDIEQFYICNDLKEPLEPIIQAIIDAGERGVMVRVIGEANFYKTYPETLDRLKQSKNISVRIIAYKNLAGGVQHAKFFTVDNEQVFFGSQNFDWKALKHIHEIGIRIKHPEAVKFYSDIFNLDWNLAEKNDKTLLENFLKPSKYNFPVKVIESKDEVLEFTPVGSPKGWLPDASTWDEPEIIKLIDSAKREVIFQVLTYSPGERGGYYAELDNALRRAAGRGVKVKLIVSDWSKRKPIIQFLKSLSVIPNIEVKLSTIPQYSGGYVSYARVEHCKYLVVDSQKSWIGTSNWERGYFYDTRNVGVIVQNDKIATLLYNIFTKDWNGPYTYLVNPCEDYVVPKYGE